jgi:dCMP deaminase
VRPDWNDYFLGIARSVAARADCRRAQHGAVLVRKDRSISSTGYNGHSPGGKSCLKGECPRGLLSVEMCPSLSSYDTGDPDHRCESQHAESNALAFAREDTTGHTLFVTGQPCAGCIRTARAHRIARIVWAEGDTYSEMTL